MPDKKSKPGPAEERLKIDLTFDEAVTKALRKPRPPGGWFVVNCHARARFRHLRIERRRPLSPACHANTSRRH